MRARRIDRGQLIWKPDLAPVAAIWMIAASVLMTVYINPSHAILVDLPVIAPDELGPLTPNENLLAIDGTGPARWNGHPVSDVQLRQILQQAALQVPQPALRFDPDAGTRYNRVIHVLAIIRSQGLIDRCFKFSGLARYQHYDALYDPSALVPYHSEACERPPV